MKKPTLQQLAFTGLLVAIGVVLSQLVSITLPTPSNPIIKFGIGYVPIIIASILYGPIVGALAGLSQDLLGFFLIGGPIFGQTFHPGFTLNAIVYGIIPGLLFLFFRSSKKQNQYFYINFVVIGIFVLMVAWYFFDIEQVDVLTLDGNFNYWLVGMSLVSAIVLSIFNVWTHRRTGYKYPLTQLLFIVTILYIIVSLVFTPFWLYLMNPGISFWARIPLRIIKMPIEIIAYVLVLTPLLHTIDSLIHKVEE